MRSGAANQPARSSPLERCRAFAMNTVLRSPLLYAVIWFFAIIACAFALKGHSRRDRIEVGLTGLAFTFVMLRAQSSCRREVRE